MHSSHPHVRNANMLPPAHPLHTHPRDRDHMLDRDGDHHHTLVANAEGRAAPDDRDRDPADDLERAFDSALQHTRSSFLEMVSAKDQVILDLRTDLARRDAYVQELALRISSLEHDVAAAEKRNADLASVIRKMYSVRQQMDSFVEDEPLVAEILRKPSASVSGLGYHGGDSSGLDHSHHQQSIEPYRHQQQQQPSSSRFSTHAVPRSPRSPTSVSRTGAAYRTSRSPSPANSLRALRATTSRPGRPLSESGAPITTGFESKDHLPTAPSRPRTEVYQPYPTTTTTSTRLASSNTPIPIRPPPPPPPYPATSATETVVPATPPSHHQHATGTSVDGRDFFRLARRTLSYDEFTSLLTNVKAFNARQQSRQTTLDNVVAVLGGRYPEIERAFVGLMMHGVASESGDHGRSTAAAGKSAAAGRGFGGGGKQAQSAGQQQGQGGRQGMQHVVGTTVPGV